MGRERGAEGRERGAEGSERGIDGAEGWERGALGRESVAEGRERGADGRERGTEGVDVSVRGAVGRERGRVSCFRTVGGRECVTATLSLAKVLAAATEASLRTVVESACFICSNASSNPFAYIICSSVTDLGNVYPLGVGVARPGF